MVKVKKTWTILKKFLVCRHFLSLPVETQKNLRKYLVEHPLCYKQNNSTYDITLNWRRRKAYTERNFVAALFNFERG